MVSTIAVIPDLVMSRVQALAQSIRELPPPDRVRSGHDGSSTGVTWGFYNELQMTAERLSGAVLRVAQEMESVEQAIRLAAADLLEADSSNADSARVLLQLVESASEIAGQAPATALPVGAPTPTGTVPAADTPAESGDSRGVYGA